MKEIVVISGKGGTGKTTLAALILGQLLAKKDGKSILAVDADPNANLDQALGVVSENSIVSIVDEITKSPDKVPQGMTKDRYLEYQIQEALVEAGGFDLLTMGRGEGPECYCYPNLLLRKFADSLAGNYAYVVMDNEAGMEHLSRRTTQNIDELLLISDHSVKGIRTIARIRDLVSEIKLVVNRQSVIINFVRTGLDPLVDEELARLGIEPAAIVPWDEEVRQCDIRMKSLLDLPDTSKAVTAVTDLMAKLLNIERIHMKRG